MLTSQQILDLVGKEPKRGMVGAVAAHQRALQGPMNTMNAPMSHARFLADMADMFTATPRTARQYQHPATDPRVMQAKPMDGLSPADIAWLQRLPLDPEQVSYDDAVQLAAMASHVSRFNDASSARLLASVWLPVKEVHDAQAAEAALANAQVTAPPVPASVLPALTDAIAAEVPQLQPDEAAGRAGDLLRAALDRRTTARETAAADARAAIANAKRASAARTSAVKTRIGATR